MRLSARIRKEKKKDYIYEIGMTLQELSIKNTKLQQKKNEEKYIWDLK